MAAPISAASYVELGEMAGRVQFPANLSPFTYAVTVKELARLVTTCQFDAGIAAAQALNRASQSYSATDFTHAAIGHLCGSASTCLAAVKAEAEKRQTIALETSEVSQRLRDLPLLLPGSNVLTDAQQQLMVEAIRCIECGAYRAAAVMGWNLAYDYMRQWVVDNNKLGDLNNGLTRVAHNRKQIVSYEDFFDKDAPSERNMIDAMAHQDSGPLIGGELHDHLKQYLRYRNKYAHASEKPASAFKTNSYIEHLIDIITAAPFV